MTFHPFGATIGNLSPPLSVANGGTGATTAAAAVTALGAVPASDQSWGPADQGLLAWSGDLPATAQGASAVLATAGTLYTIAVKVPVAISVTNIVMGLQTNGSVLTSGQCFAALFQGFAGARIGVTADQATAWGSGAAKTLTMALSGGPFAVAAGIVIVGVWFNGTTGPGFFRGGNVSALMNAGLADAASRWGTANTGLTTTAPATLGTVTATGVVAGYWAGLS